MTDEQTAADSRGCAIDADDRLKETDEIDFYDSESDLTPLQKAPRAGTYYEILTNSPSQSSTLDPAINDGARPLRTSRPTWKHAGKVRWSQSPSTSLPHLQPQQRKLRLLTGVVTRTHERSLRSDVPSPTHPTRRLPDQLLFPMESSFSLRAWRVLMKTTKLLQSAATKRLSSKRRVGCLLRIYLNS